MFVHILGVPAVSTSSKTEGITLTFFPFLRKNFQNLARREMAEEIGRT
jgi:hypothetical protein